MIPRYTREAIGSIWTQRRKMQGWLEVELAVVDALVAEGIVPAVDAEACRERASFTVEAVEEREQTTNHDVAAFVDVVGESPPTCSTPPWRSSSSRRAPW
jgi:adenylosuccinate lyase